MKKLLFVFALFATQVMRAQSLHGDLDTWRDYGVATVPDSSFQAPLYWNTTDSLIFLSQGFFTGATFSKQVFQTTDAHSGGFAARLVTRRQDTLGLLPALMTNTDIAIDFGAFSSGDMNNALVFSGGAVVTARIPSVSAWVKYSPAGTDTAFVRVEAIRSFAAASGGDSVIGYGKVYITGLCSSYTQIVADISYTDATTTPDLVRVFVSSSGLASQDGSELLIDDINIPTTSVKDVNMPVHYMAYPVPATDHISFSGTLKGLLLVQIFYADGRAAGSYKVQPGEPVKTADLPAGQYYYTIVNYSEGVAEGGKFVLVK